LFLDPAQTAIRGPRVGEGTKVKLPHPPLPMATYGPATWTSF